MKAAALVLALVLVPCVAQAQVYTTSNRLVWGAPINAMDVADAQQAVYKLYVDGKPWGDLVGHTCRSPEPTDTVATCDIPLPLALVAVVNKRKVSLSLTVRDPEPGSAEIGPGPALVIKRPFQITMSAVTIAPP